MATSPFTAAFEASLKTAEQAALFDVISGTVVAPQFFCCISGLSVGVDKDPVARIKITSGRRECTCSTVTVDYSGCWSPTSTIVSVEVDWGDGNISNPAWPGAGTVSHPGGCGGYALPGTYTITVTVTDMLGATGFATTQVEIVDCTTWALVEMFCSLYQVGSPGFWFSNDLGGNWADRSGHVLANTRIYSFEINPHTIPFWPESTTDNTTFVEIWAATEKGLYVTYDGARTGGSWQLVSTFPSMLEVTAVLPSKVDPLEVYVLANNVANNRVWLYRTTDGGQTWDNLELVPVTPGEWFQVQAYGWSHTLDMSRDGYYIYITLLDKNGYTECIRVLYDLSTWATMYSGSAASTWGGVRCDYNEPSSVWHFGHFDVGGPSMLFSDDDGATWNGRDYWSGHDVEVRPVLPSLFDPNYVVAFNNDPGELETAVSYDRGVTWIEGTLDHLFVNHCGERGWFDPYYVLEGARTVPVTNEHLELSINLGESMWTERSGGLPVDAEVTCIKILYEHF